VTGTGNLLDAVITVLARSLGPPEVEGDALACRWYYKFPGVEFTKSISGARPHPNPRCRDAIREQIAAP
jgi:hypothetical protein